MQDELKQTPTFSSSSALPDLVAYKTRKIRARMNRTTTASNSNFSRVENFLLDSLALSGALRFAGWSSTVVASGLKYTAFSWIDLRKVGDSSPTKIGFFEVASEFARNIMTPSVHTVISDRKATDKKPLKSRATTARIWADIDRYSWGNMSLCEWKCIVLRDTMQWDS